MIRNEGLATQLLDAAERLYASNGNKGMTVRTLAKGARTTTQTTYTYFGSQQGVVQAMHDRAVEAVLVDWVPTQATRLRTLADGAEALPDTITSFLQLLADHPVLRRFLIEGHGPRNIGPPTELTVNACVVKVTAVFDMCLSVDGRPDGEAPARILIAQLIGVAHALETGFAKVDHGGIVDLILGGEVLA